MLLFELLLFLVFPLPFDVAGGRDGPKDILTSVPPLAGIRVEFSGAWLLESVEGMLRPRFLPLFDALEKEAFPAEFWPFLLDMLLLVVVPSKDRPLLGQL